jgi:hypothetical protein
MRATIDFQFPKSELQKFDATCQIAIQNVFKGTKKATTAAAQEILGESMAQVPKETYTLLMSAYYEVSRRSDTALSAWAYEAIIGYGGNGDPINPKTGRSASSYMLAVHEDLSATHVNGKAKFLEDPVREYAANNFQRTVFKYAQESLATMSD